MNKKLLSVFIVLLLTGLVLGGGIHNMISLYSDSPKLSEKEKPTTLRRFGDGNTVKSVSENSTESLSGKTKDRALSEGDSYLRDITKMDTEEILAEIDRLSKKTRSARAAASMDNLALSFLYSRLGQKAPRQALEQIKQNPDLRTYENQVLKAWSEKNPEAAMAYCLEEKNAENIFEKAGIIAKVSPEKTLEWIKDFPDHTMRMAQYGMFSAVFEFHPDKMEEFIQKVGTQIDDDPYMKEYIAGKWVDADKAAAMKWINSLPESEQIAARAGALDSLPLEEATQEVAALEGKAKEAALIKIGTSLGYKSPLQAVEWLMTNTGSDLKSCETILRSTIYSVVSRADYAELNACLTKLPAGEKKDIFVENIVDRSWYSSLNDDLRETKKSDVLSLAAQIENPKKRESSIDSVLSSWMSESPADARQWIEKSDFSPEKKESLYKSCDMYAKRQGGLIVD